MMPRLRKFIVHAFHWQLFSVLYSGPEEPKTVADIVLLLQRKCGLTEQDWNGIPRTSVDIRRSMVVKDGIREAKKPRFDTTKLLMSIYRTYVRLCAYLR